MSVQPIEITEPKSDRYLTPAQVCEIVPGMSEGLLRTMRFEGRGPRYRKPSPRVVVYLESEVRAYVESTARQGTAAEAV